MYPTVYYAVQGLYLGEWKTLFAPYQTLADAVRKMHALGEANPLCRYQVIEVTDNGN